MILKGFNALQIVSLFAAWPFLMQFLYNHDYWIPLVGASLVYAIGFIAMVIIVFSRME